jgi:hypothetical protein
MLHTTVPPRAGWRGGIDATAYVCVAARIWVGTMAIAEFCISQLSPPPSNTHTPASGRHRHSPRLLPYKSLPFHYSPVILRRPYLVCHVYRVDMKTGKCEHQPLCEASSIEAGDKRRCGPLLL